MKKAGIIIGGLFLTTALLLAGVAIATNVYHSRRFAACARELDAAVLSGKSLAAFTDDERRGWYRTYSREQRSELLQHMTTRSHTDRNYSDADAMSSRAHTSGVFSIGDMVYVLFFDGQDRLREYVCLSN